VISEYRAQRYEKIKEFSKAFSHCLTKIITKYTEQNKNSE